MDREKLLEMYEQMRLIRVFEERVAEEFAAGHIPGFVHLYAGEEAVAVGVCSNLRDDDYITSTHRGHGHCIAKGVDVNQMMAELFGRATGMCKGKGGSMHIADLDLGMLGANGIVGGGPPLACGAALKAKVLGTDQVAVTFFGDGASSQGSVHEAMNLASIRKLPVIFICENNGYGEATPAEYAVSIKDLADRANSYSMPGVVVDGQDVIAVAEAAAEAIRRARAGQGPSLLECKTYRYYGHFQGDNLRYRTEDEAAYYKSRDCLDQLRGILVGQKVATAADLDAMDRQVQSRIDEAVKFAEASPLPDPDQVFTDVYVSYR